MLEVRQTDVFAAWFVGSSGARPHHCSDPPSVAGDVKPVGSGVLEMRIDYGPGYRVYFVGRGAAVVVLLCGGDKRSQDRDIKRALELASHI